MMARSDDESENLCEHSREFDVKDVGTDVVNEADKLLDVPDLVAGRQSITSRYGTLEDLDHLPATTELPSAPGRDDIDDSTSNLQTAVNLIKANIGLGVLSLPGAVKNAGLLPGTLGVLFFGGLATHCMLLMVGCARKLSRHVGVTSLDYHEVVELSVMYGPRRLRPYAPLARKAAVTTIVFTQVGFIVVYFLFIARTLQSTTAMLNAVDHRPAFSVQIFCLLTLGPVLAVCMVKSMRVVAWWSTLGNLFCLFALVTATIYIIANLLPLPSVELVAEPRTWGLFFGSVMFSFESIGLVLPIENRMRDPAALRGCNGLLMLVMTFVVCTYAAIGFYGYLNAGANAGIILDVLPTTDFYVVVRLAYVVSIFASINLQLFPVVKFTYPTVYQTLCRRSAVLRAVGEYVWRAVVVIAACGLAMGVPCLEELISLVGALVSSSIAVIFPPMCHALLSRASSENDSRRGGGWLSAPPSLASDAAIAALGVLGAGVGTYNAVHTIVVKMSAGQCSI